MRTYSIKSHSIITIKITIFIVIGDCLNCTVFHPQIVFAYF